MQKDENLEFLKQRRRPLRLAGVVTLYYPNKDIVPHILSYLPELDILYVLDNSEKINEDIAQQIRALPHVHYVSFGENTGISYALNYALNKANDKGYKYLLTMDQDSYFLPKMMSQYKEFVTYNAKENYFNKVAMFCVHYTRLSEKKYFNDKPQFIKVGITSGSIIPIQLAIENGGFDENLFIDEVDSEYCYRMENQGFKVLELPNIILNHSLGNPTKHHLLNYNFITFNHNALRKYYITRNKIYVMKKYPMVRKSYIEMLIKMTLKVILVEENKISKLKYIIKGCKDGFLNHMGKNKVL